MGASMAADGVADRLGPDLFRPACDAGDIAVSRTRWADSPLTIALLAFLMYGMYLAMFFVKGNDARQLIHMYRAPFARSNVSKVITIDPRFHYSSLSQAYDGQWIYFIALDPVHARSYMLDPAYRYTKILYPLSARALAIGRADLVPYTLILINLVAIIAGTWLLASWLRRRTTSPWYALIYPLYLGTFFSFTHDLTEPLSYGLAILGLYLLEWRSVRRVLGAAVCFGLAALARDKAVLLSGVYLLALLLRPLSVDGGSIARRMGANVPLAAIFGATALLPLLALKVFLRFWLQTDGGAAGAGVSGALTSVGVQANAQATPLAGVVSGTANLTVWIVQLLSVYLPAFALILLIGWFAYRRQWSVELSLLGISLVTSVVILNPVYFAGDWHGVIRVSMFTVIASVLCAPLFTRVLASRPLRTGWLAACVVAPCVLTPFLAIASFAGA